MLELKKKDIKNIMIYISDSLRWDYLPKSIASMGRTYKTVASSLYTASSFPSMVSGLYPPRHKVFSWNDKIGSSHVELFRSNEINSSMWCETTWPQDPPDYSDIHRILRVGKGTSLDEIEPPFLYLEDDKGGHCPYGHDFDDYGNKGCEQFFKDYSRENISVLRGLYAKSVEKSKKNFFKRMQTLKKRGLLDETLVIFSSDHGELLGEYGGLIGHGRPPCPEMVHVPTVFIHKSIQPGTDEESILRHVDFYPTISSILGLRSNYEVDGKDITTNNVKLGLNYRLGSFLKAQGINKHFIYNSESIWDRNGGLVRHKLKRLKSIPFFTYRILSKHFEFLYITSQSKGLGGFIKNYKRSMKALTGNNLKYGDPGFDQEIADLIFKQYEIKMRKWKEEDRISKGVLNKIDKKKL
jgi:hypothetical protein